MPKEINSPQDQNAQDLVETTKLLNEIDRLRAELTGAQAAISKVSAIFDANPGWVDVEYDGILAKIFAAISSTQVHEQSEEVAR